MNTYEMLEEAAHRAYTRGIQTGNGGNLSARADFGMIVKSSGGSFADCLADGTGFVETDLDGSVLSPSGKPTREVVLHGLMYKLCPECGGVMHCHSPWSVAWAYSHDVLPMTTLHVQLKIGYDIPVFDIPSANVRPRLLSGPIRSCVPLFCAGTALSLWVRMFWKRSTPPS